MTTRSLEWERSVMISSVMPSAKRSHVESLPMLSNGKTAMEAFSDNGADGVHHFHALKPARNTSKTAAMEAARIPKEVLRARGWDATEPCEGSKGRSGVVASGRSSRVPGAAGCRNSICGVYLPFGRSM